MAVDQLITKCCTRCGLQKPLSEFGRHKGKDHGNPACRPCNNARGRKWYAGNAEARQTSIKAYADAHKDERRIYGARYYQENREELDAINREWYRKNPDIRNAVARQDYHRNSAAYNARARRYRAENPEKCSEIARQWKADNPEQVSALQRNYKARKRSAEGSHTAEDILDIYARQDGCCYYCDDPLGLDYHVDHRQPLSRGGSNDPDNLAIACCPCNLSKKDKTEAEFFKAMKREAA